MYNATLSHFDPTVFLVEFSFTMENRRRKTSGDRERTSGLQQLYIFRHEHHEHIHEFQYTQCIFTSSGIPGSLYQSPVRLYMFWFKLLNTRDTKQSHL